MEGSQGADRGRGDQGVVGGVGGGVGVGGVIGGVVGVGDGGGGGVGVGVGVGKGGDVRGEMVEGGLELRFGEVGYEGDAEEMCQWGLRRHGRGLRV